MFFQLFNTLFRIGIDTAHFKHKEIKERYNKIQALQISDISYIHIQIYPNILYIIYYIYYTITIQDISTYSRF